MYNGKRISLDEISKKIGISRSTIYKVVNNKEGVREITRQRVEKALKKYNYVPNYSARNLAKHKEYRIGYVGMNHSPNTYFFDITKAAMLQAQADYADSGLNLYISETEFDHPEQQVAEVEKLFKMGIRDFIICVTDVDVLRDTIKKLRSNSCNVIFHNRYSDEANIIYFGVDYYQSGVVLGELIGKLMPEGGKIALVLNADVISDQYIERRYRGFMDQIRNFPLLKIEKVYVGVRTDDDVKKTAKEIIQSGEITGIVDVSYRTDVLAATLEKAGKGKEMTLVGFDVYKEVIPYIKKSVIDAVVGQDLYGQAYQAVEGLFEKMCYGASLRKRIFNSRIDIIMSSNVDGFDY